MRRMLVVVVLCVFVSATPAQAELIDFGGGLIYDTLQDLTWLDPFYAAPPHTVMSGVCSSRCDWNYTWSGATAWVAGLWDQGYDDWRLPNKFRPGVWGGDNEFQLMLEQVSGWEFGLDDVLADVPGRIHDPVLVQAGEQGPFLSPLTYLFVWMDETYTWTSPFAGVGYDFPDSQASSAGGLARVHPVRRGVPFSRGPEPSTLGLIGIGVLVGIARAGRRRANNQ